MCPVSISAAVPDAPGCSPSTGRCPIPATAPLDLSGGQLKGRWPPSFSPTELLWKTTGSCLMMLGAGSGIGCLLGVSLGVAVCCQSSGTRAFRVRPPVSGPSAPAGNRPVPLWLGTEAPPLCRLCGCSDHGEGVVHAGSAVPILVPPRMAATWPVPPLCQGPRHLQERASAPAWGVCAPSRPPGLIRGPSGVSAPSQPGQSCGRWSPRQMRPIARMRLHLWVRPQLPGQRPRIQLLQNWFPFGSVAACLLPPRDA